MIVLWMYNSVSRTLCQRTLQNSVAGLSHAVTAITSCHRWQSSGPSQSRMLRQPPLPLRVASALPMAELSFPASLTLKALV